MHATDSFWPDGARLAISFSLMFGGGGQPISGAPVDKYQVKLTSFMIGEAVDKAPDLAREIVARGHEAGGAHGRSWQNSYLLDPDAERRFIIDGVGSIQKAAGQTPVGWNACYVRWSRRVHS